MFRPFFFKDEAFYATQKEKEDQELRKRTKNKITMAARSHDRLRVEVDITDDVQSTYSLPQCRKPKNTDVSTRTPWVPPKLTATPRDPPEGDDSYLAHSVQHSQRMKLHFRPNSSTRAKVAAANSAITLEPMPPSPDRYRSIFEQSEKRPLLPVVPALPLFEPESAYSQSSQAASPRKSKADPLLNSSRVILPARGGLGGSTRAFLKATPEVPSIEKSLLAASQYVEPPKSHYAMTSRLPEDKSKWINHHQPFVPHTPRKSRVFSYVRPIAASEVDAPPKKTTKREAPLKYEPKKSLAIDEEKRGFVPARKSSKHGYFDKKDYLPM